MSNNIKNEYEGYLILAFDNPIKANNFLKTYQVYEQFWVRKHLFGLITSINKEYQNTFKEFECIIMKKEPEQIGVDYHQGLVIIKLWFVCKLQENKLSNNQETNKELIIDYVKNNIVNNLQIEFDCKTILQYLDIAADIQE